MQQNNKQIKDKRKTFLSHLEELRWTLFIAFITIIIGFIISFKLRYEIIKFLCQPIKPLYQSENILSFLQAISPAEGFLLSIKTSLWTAILITAPILLGLLFQFVKPGLKKQEKKSLFAPLFATIPLFLIGASFAYYLALPKILAFFHNYNIEMGISNDWRLSEYLSFVLQMIFIFGICFQLPLCILLLVKLGLLEQKTMQSSRRYAYIIILIISAILTPTPDMITLLLLALPLIILYEICILISRLIK